MALWVKKLSSFFIFHKQSRPTLSKSVCAFVFFFFDALSLFSLWMCTQCLTYFVHKNHVGSQCISLVHNFQLSLIMYACMLLSEKKVQVTLCVCLLLYWQNSVVCWHWPILSFFSHKTDMLFVFHSVQQHLFFDSKIIQTFTHNGTTLKIVSSVNTVPLFFFLHMVIK